MVADLHIIPLIICVCTRLNTMVERGEDAGTLSNLIHSIIITIDHSKPTLKTYVIRAAEHFHLSILLQCAIRIL